MEYKAPDRIDQQSNYAKSIGDAMSLCEWVPEPTRCSDVFLQQVATNDQAYENADPTVPQGVGKETRGSHQKKNQWTRHLQPIWEMSRKEKPQHNSNEGNPFSKLSS